MKKIAYGFVLLLAASAAGGYAMAMQKMVTPDHDTPKVFSPIPVSAASRNKCVAYCTSKLTECNKKPDTSWCDQTFRECRRGCPH